MVRRCIALGLLLLASRAFAQVVTPVANAASTGTTLNELAIINASTNTAVIATTSSTSVPVYIVSQNAGTTGQAWITLSGPASCVMDTAVSSAAGYYVIASTTTGGYCHPQSAAPSAGVYLIGYLSAISTSSGVAAQVNVIQQIYGGSGSGGCANALTMNNGGSGAASGTTFNCGTPETLSYNTLGASPTAGSTSLVTLGTVTTGTWNATAIGLGYGGTGAASAGAAVSNLLGNPASGTYSINCTTSSNCTYTAAGSGSITGSGTTGYLSKFTGSSAIGSSLVDEGITTANVLTVADTGGLAVAGTGSSSITIGASGTLGALLLGNATSGLITLEPATGAITSYTIQLPVVQPTSGSTYLSCTAASPAVCTWAAGGSFTPQTNGTNNATLTGINFLTSTTNAQGLTITPSNPSTTGEKFEITGANPTFTSVSTGTAPSITAGTGGMWAATEGTGPTGVSTVDALYADSTAHAIKEVANGGSALTLAMITGSITTGHCVEWASAITIEDAGAACGSGSGAVSSVSGDGTIITNSASTGAVTLTIAGTSGGIPYFSSTSGWASSALLAQHGLLVGGGAGAAPAALAVGGANFPLIGQSSANPTFSTIAYPTSLTSGGILYGSSSTALSSSAALAADGVVYGGGAGAAPAATAAGTTGTVLIGTTSSAPSFSATPNVTSISTGTAPSITAGSGGMWAATEGTGPTGVSATDALYADSTAHAFMATVNGGTAGLVEMVAPGKIHSTGNTASISTATLCAASAGACNQTGNYRISYDFTQGGTACSSVTAGGVTLTISWTDTNGNSKSMVVPVANLSTPTTVSAGLNFTTSNTTGFGSGVLDISTNGTVIQYATTYTACTTGTGTYQLDAQVTRLQ